MTRTIPVVDYDRAAHEPALYAFTAKVLGKEVADRRARVLSSFHERMPGRERGPLRHILLDGDRVAGTLGYLPVDFLVNGVRVPSRFTHDLLIDPEYRGGGLAKLIVAHQRSLGGFLPGGMWMTDPCWKIHLACGFDDVAPLGTQTLVLDAGAFVRQRKLPALKALAARVGLTAAAMRAKNGAAAIVRRGGSDVTAVERFDPAHDAAWLAMASGYGATRVRDAAFLNWKYTQHPFLDYRRLVAMRDGKPAGFLVWRPAPAGASEPRAVIPDYLVAKGDMATFRLLVARAVVDAAAARVPSLAILTTQSAARESLRTMGFLNSRTPNTWVVAGWQGILQPEWLKDHDAWHAVLGDSDGDIWVGSM